MTEKELETILHDSAIAGEAPLPDDLVDREEFVSTITAVIGLIAEVRKLRAWIKLHPHRHISAMCAAPWILGPCTCGAGELNRQAKELLG